MKLLLAKRYRSRRKTSVKSDMGSSTTNKYTKKAVKTLTQRVKQLEKNVAQEERKHIHNILEYTGPASISNIPFITHLSPIPQGTAGTGVSERSGEEVSAQFLDLYLRWVYATGTDDNEACRMIVFRWKSPDTNPTANDILLNNPGGGATITYVDSPYVVDNRENFDVLFDKRFMLDENTGDQGMIRFKYTFPQGKSSRIKWDGPGASDREENHIYVMVMSETLAPVVGATATGYYRLYFKDN